jgi:hypothetical protein
MANNRIFYACQALGVERMTTTGQMVPVHGVQSVGINTSFNLEQAFEYGQIQIYENIEGLPDIEVTVERVLDGYPLLYHLAASGATSSALVSRTKERCNIALGIGKDDENAMSGIPPVEVWMSGMYFSSLSYSLATDGNCTESVTFVGNHKVWNIPATKLTSNVIGKLVSYGAGGPGLDQPYALISSSGGIQRRENVKMNLCILPQSIYGVAANYDAGNAYLNGAPSVHIQNCSISTDVGRDDISELGRKAPYYRSPNFPIEVKCEFDVISISGDWVSAYEEGVSDYVGTVNEGNNTKQETIKMVLQDGTTFDLGSKNRLASVSYGGGDAGGGNVSNKYSYTTFNDLTITHPRDPCKAANPNNVAWVMTVN